MSYVALVTDRYDEMVRFYGEHLGFAAISQWDRDNARGITMQDLTVSAGSLW